jgi:hypothetical protein
VKNNSVLALSPPFFREKNAYNIPANNPFWLLCGLMTFPDLYKNKQEIDTKMQVKIRIEMTDWPNTI